MRVPFNRPFFCGGELDNVAQALKNNHLSGGGSFTKKCHALLERELGTARALLTTSCTHALEMAAILLDLGAGDEVICPSFTFVSTPNAFVLRGAQPRFADIRPDTLNIDESALERLVTPRTKAIVPVHYAGVACEMDTILAIAKAHGVAVVEDNAHGLFAKYRGRFLGTLGTFGAQSFHETKNFTCGEGGALLVNDARYVARAEIVREKGTDRSRFLRGEVDKYSWVDMGSSYPASDMLAAFLLAQLESRRLIQERRRHVWQAYRTGLAGWAEHMGVALPPLPTAEGEPAYHMFYVIAHSPEQREALRQHLLDRQVQAVTHYLPLHVSPMGLKLGGRAGQCPVTESVAGRLLRLPFYTGMTDEEQAYVIDSARAFSERSRRVA